jgi:hypothetical protein
MQLQLGYLLLDENYITPDRSPISRCPTPTTLVKAFATILGAATGLLLACATVYLVALVVWWLAEGH